MECRSRSEGVEQAVHFDLGSPLALTIEPTPDGGCRVRVLNDGLRELDFSSVLAGYAAVLALLATVYRVGEAFL